MIGVRFIVLVLLLAGASLRAQEPAPAATPPLVLAATPAASPPTHLKPTPVAPMHDSFYSGDRSAGQGIAQLAGYLVLLVGLFAAGIYVLRNGIPSFRIGPKLDRKLRIEETKSLGGRQFLVVAEYEGQRMLLGVCPGRIDHLCVLKSAEAPVFPKIAPEEETPS